MIKQSETQLTQAQYDALKALETGATHTYTLQQLDLEFAALGGSDDSSLLYDAAQTNDYVFRAYISGTTLYVYRYTTSWPGTQVLSVSGVDSSVPPAIATALDGDVVFVAYYKSGSIYSNRSASLGSSWGGETLVKTLSNVVWLAASREYIDDYIVHAATWDTHNTRLYRYYSATGTGSWNEQVSDFYYPAQFTSFDAGSFWDSSATSFWDLVVFTAIGDSRYGMPRQGVWGVRVENGRWGDPYEIDVVDRYITTAGWYDGEYLERTLRSAVKVSLSGVIRMYITYVAEENGRTWTCWSYSSDGRFWEVRQPLGNLAQPAKLMSGAACTKVNAVGRSKGWQSSVRPLAGYSTGDVDISDDIQRVSVSWDNSWASTIELANDDGSYDFLLSGDHRYQVVEELGYYKSDGTKLVQQVAISIVDAITRTRQGGQNVVSLRCRDSLAYLSDRAAADEYEEWEGPSYNGDDFADLSHTAGVLGSWQVNASGELVLASNDSVGYALTSIDAHIGHTIAQSAIYIPSGTGQHWAGILFRVKPGDQTIDSGWCVTYNSDTDAIYLQHCVSGSWQAAVASKTSMGWTTNTWYLLRVEARLSEIKVYYATPDATYDWDKVTWAHAFTYIDVTDTQYFEGYVGHLGRGPYDDQTEVGVSFDTHLVMAARSPLVVEDAVRCLAEYAGVHKFKFDDLSLTWDTAGATGTWSTGSNYVTGTGGGASQWDWLLSNEEVPESFVMRFTFNEPSALRGGVAFLAEGTGGTDERCYLIWDSTYIALYRHLPAGEQRLVARIPNTITGVRDVTLALLRDPNGEYFVYAWYDSWLAFAYYLNYQAAAHFKIGFGVWGTDSSIDYTNIRMAQLSDVLPQIVLDVGESPAGALRRAIGHRSVQMFMRFNGALRAWRPDTQTSTRTLALGDLDSFQESIDFRAIKTHIRLIGAYHTADAWDTTLLPKAGHRFAKYDNSELMTQDAVNEAVAKLLTKNNAAAHRAVAEGPLMVFQELEDRITIGTDDWVVDSMQIQRNAGAWDCRLTLRKYEYA